MTAWPLVLILVNVIGNHHRAEQWNEGSQGLKVWHCPRVWGEMLSSWVLHVQIILGVNNTFLVPHLWSWIYEDKKQDIWEPSGFHERFSGRSQQCCRGCVWQVVPELSRWILSCVMYFLVTGICSCVAIWKRTICLFICSSIVLIFKIYVST